MKFTLNQAGVELSSVVGVPSAVCCSSVIECVFGLGALDLWDVGGWATIEHGNNYLIPSLPYNLRMDPPLLFLSLH